MDVATKEGEVQVVSEMTFLQNKDRKVGGENYET